MMATDKVKEWDIPLFAAQIDLKKAFDHVDRNQAMKAVKEHGVDKQHLALDLKTVGTTRLTIEARTLQIEKFRTTRWLPQGAGQKGPRCSHYWRTQCWQRRTKTGGIKRKESGFRLDEWYSPSVAPCGRHCGNGNITKKLLEQMIVDLADCSNEKGLEIGHAKTNGSSTHKPRAPRLKAGDAEVAWQKKTEKRRDLYVDERSSAPSVQHRMKQAQETHRTWHTMLCCRYTTLDKGMEALEKAV